MYSTFQSHEPEFDYLKSLEIEEKINKIRWLRRKNPAHFLLSTNGKWKSISCLLLGPLLSLSNQIHHCSGNLIYQSSKLTICPAHCTSLSLTVMQICEHSFSLLPLKICKLKWSKRFCLLSDKTIKLWKVSERDRRAEGYNLKEESGQLRDCSSITSLRVPVLKPMELMVEASPRRIFANAHTYHINSISVNSDQETYLSADDLRINLWHMEITDQSFSIL